jgi:rhodanese-related sulfurtransferase
MLSFTPLVAQNAAAHTAAMPTTTVSQIPAADAARALAHFEQGFSFETDCWDVHHALGQTPDFVLLDVRSPEAFAAGHVPGATNLPQAKIIAGTLAPYPADTLFVVYCAGPHCNGAQRAAVRLARLGRPVKVMIGGMSGWREEGFRIATEPNAQHMSG